jgi:hypothetical protein
MQCPSNVQVESFDSICVKVAWNELLLLLCAAAVMATAAA